MLKKYFHNFPSWCNCYKQQLKTACHLIILVQCVSIDWICCTIPDLYNFWTPRLHLQLRPPCDRKHILFKLPIICHGFRCMKLASRYFIIMFGCWFWQSFCHFDLYQHPSFFYLSYHNHLFAPNSNNWCVTRYKMCLTGMFSTVCLLRFVIFFIATCLHVLFFFNVSRNSIFASVVGMYHTQGETIKKCPNIRWLRRSLVSPRICHKKMIDINFVSNWAMYDAGIRIKVLGSCQGKITMVKKGLHQCVFNMRLWIVKYSTICLSELDSVHGTFSTLMLTELTCWWD